VAKIPAAKSPHEEAFAIAWRVLNGPPFEREYKFALPPRQWRFDFAWPEAKIAVEIDGGVHEGPARGRHMRQAGYEKDAEKMANAALMGFRVIRLTPSMIQPALLNRLILEVRRCAP
jgi:very-short-patch-repair endonuclease